MHVGETVGAVLDHAALELIDRLDDVRGDRAGLGVRHEAAGTEHAAELADGGHHVRRRDRHVEVGHAALDLGGEIVGADELRTGLTSGRGGLALGEHRNADVLAGTGREGHGAADHLIGLARIDPETDHDVDGLVELLRTKRLDDADGLFVAVQTITIELLRVVAVLLVFRHGWLPLCSRRPVRCSGASGEPMWFRLWC